MRIINSSSSSNRAIAFLKLPVRDAYPSCSSNCVALLACPAHASTIFLSVSVNTSWALSWATGFPIFRQIVNTKDSASIRISGSRRPAFRQRSIMSRMPVPIRSIYFVRYMGSASKGLCGTEAWGPRSFSRVSGIIRQGKTTPPSGKSKKTADFIVVEILN